MGTKDVTIPARAFIPASSNGARHKIVEGTNFPIAVLAFDASTIQTAFASFIANAYGSGNITLTLYLYAASASSGDSVWEASIAAVTPNTDTGDIESKAFATAQTATLTHPGTTGKRQLSVAITISNLDSIAAGDMVVVKLRRLTSGNTMTGDGYVEYANLQYSDV